MADIEKVIDALNKAKAVIEAWIPMFEQYNSPFSIDCAIELLKEQQEQIENLKQTAQSMMEGIVVNQPQIVRCKDCIHWDKGHTEECDNSDSVCFHNGWCKPDWFCADSEPKET